jgi:hypothetical protein
MKLLDNSTSKFMKDDLGHRPPPIFASLLWSALRLSMWCWAILGPLLVVLGVIARFVDFPDSLFSPSKGDPLGLFGILGGIGVSFVWLRLRGYIKFNGE